MSDICTTINKALAVGDIMVHAEQTELATFPATPRLPATSWLDRLLTDDTLCEDYLNYMYEQRAYRGF